MSGWQTNEEFVLKLMRFSKRGALMQLFVIQAIDAYATEVIFAAEQGAPQAWPHSIMSWEAWVDVAKEVKREIECRNLD